MDKIHNWLKITKYKDFSIMEASTDASFRKYHRLMSHNENYLLMDSSLEKDSLLSFIDVTSRLLKIGVTVPKILETNTQDGFLIIEDFGETHYLDILEENNFKLLYSKAINEIINMQQADTSNLPLYDREFLHVEMDLMQEWYFTKLLRKILSPDQKEIIQTTFERISKVVLSQPHDDFVHRDYHSRNIMLTSNNKLGIIDYQDAMRGPITYDLVSLLKDCYIEFEREDILELALQYRDKKGLPTNDKEFIKWFDFMGMQRHIKVLGIFSRLYIRDKKKGYLNDIPLTLKYLFDTAILYEETKPLALLIKSL